MTPIELELYLKDGELLDSNHKVHIRITEEMIQIYPEVEGITGDPTIETFHGWPITFSIVENRPVLHINPNAKADIDETKTQVIYVDTPQE